MSQVSWYYMRNGSLHGPASEQEIQRLFIAKIISNDTLVWHQGLTEWRRLDQAEFCSQNLLVLPPALPKENLNESFSNKGSPISRILTLTILFALILPALYGAYSLLNFAFGLQDFEHWKLLERTAFFIYLCLYAGFWSAYFLSRRDDTYWSVATLRRLLYATSMQWNQATNYTKEEIEKGFQEKGRTSITAMAMLVAASLIELAQVNGILIRLDTVKNGVETLALDIWSASLLAVTAFAAFSALVCFLISADALDSLFNKFRSERLSHRLMHHFYTVNINPRYYGLVLLTTGAIFLIAFHSPLMGCMSIGVLISVGYRHWFPFPDLISEEEPKLNGAIGVLSRLGVLVVPPLLLLISKLNTIF